MTKITDSRSVSYHSGDSRPDELDNADNAHYTYTGDTVYVEYDVSVYECDHEGCNERFNSSQALASHVNSAHNNE